MLLFILLYRLGEAQLLKITPFFLLDPRGQADWPWQTARSD